MGGQRGNSSAGIWVPISIVSQAREEYIDVFLRPSSFDGSDGDLLTLQSVHSSQRYTSNTSSGKSSKLEIPPHKPR
jgi:hypothetical protein